MHEEKEFHLPTPFQNPAFFDREIVRLSPDDFFYFDLVYLSGMNGKKPWEMCEKELPPLFVRWKEMAHEIENTMKKPFKTDQKKMMAGLGLFLEILYWMNGQPVHSLQLDEVKKLEMTPANIADRLEFILARPTQYHAFIQLKELFAEAEKMFYKQLAMKKAKKKRSP